MELATKEPGFTHAKCPCGGKVVHSGVKLVGDLFQLSAECETCDKRWTWTEAQRKPGHSITFKLL